MPDPATQLQRTARFDLKALYETSRLLSASLDLEFVLNNLLLTAMSKLLVARGMVLLFDPLEQGYKAASVKGISGVVPGSIQRIAVISADRPLHREEIPPDLVDRRIELVIPVRYGYREIGLIALGGKATGQPFENLELEFIQSLVNMTSAAVHNSLMVEELKQANRDLDGRIQQLNTLFDLSQEFNATVDRKHLVKLLSFALMGQMLVGKYLLLLRRTTIPGETGNGPPFRVVASKGVGGGEPEADLMQRLSDQKELVVLDGEQTNGAAVWEGLRRRGLSVILPLTQHGETCGILCLGPKMTGQPYGPADIEFLYSLGNLAFVSIQNSYLVEEQIEKERLEEEMRLARGIQERLLPQELPSFSTVDVATLAFPSRMVGGDYFDVVKLERERLLLAIADVTGKGVPASLLMANLQACLHVLLPMDISLEEAVSHINRVICDNTNSDKFITFFCGIYHPDARRFEYVNAGHNPPMLVRAAGEVELLEVGGLLLGVMKGLPYQRGSVTLEQGDVLALFTDGVTEAMSADSEEYGENRLQSTLLAHRGKSSRDIADAVYSDIQHFTGSPAMLSDDLTMVVMKVLG
jgi:phosphoserine phosphatase RsbU/P